MKPSYAPIRHNLLKLQELFFYIQAAAETSKGSVLVDDAVVGNDDLNRALTVDHAHCPANLDVADPFGYPTIARRSGQNEF